MIELNAKLARDADVKLAGRLRLPYELRQKSRLLTHLESGEEARLMLPPGTILRSGDLLSATDGRTIAVVAEPERTLQADCASPQELARAAYHLGNRHVAVEIGDGWLRISEDHVLRQMLIGLGLSVSDCIAPFEPEAGAYGHHHASATHGGIIHEFGANHQSEH